MKKLLCLLLFLVCCTAQAQFTPGQTLTATQLNTQLGLKTTYTAGNLTAHAVLLGNGNGDIIALGSLGANGSVLISGGAGVSPAFGAVSCVMVYPGVGIPSSNGSAWNASYGTTGGGTNVVLSNNPTIFGTTTNDDAGAGVYQEFPVTTDLSAVSVTSTTITNLSSVSLTAGDYEISGVVRFIPAGTTTVASIAAGVSTTTGALGPVGSASLLQATFTTGAVQNLVAPLQRIKLASTTTVYLVGQVTFGVSTLTANGYMQVRRVR